MPPTHLHASSYVVPYEQVVLQKPSYEAMQQALSSALTKQALGLQGRYGGQCIIYARNFVKAPKGQLQGYAGNLRANSKTPHVGGLILFPTHVGVVLDFDDKTLTFTDSNWDLKGHIAIQTISLLDKKIKGYMIL